jgi:hypothetical protein
MQNGLDRLTEIHSRRMEIWLVCTSCGHTRHYHPSTLSGHLTKRLADDDDTLLNAARFFRCSACRSRQVMLVPYAPETAKTAA